MKHTLLFLTFLILGFLGASTDAQAKDENAPLRIAFNNPGYADKGFWKSVTDVMRAAADDLNIQVDVWHGDRSASQMRINANEIYSSDEKYDYVILVNEHQQGAGFLRKAEEHKIKTIFLLNTLHESQLKKFGNPGEIFSCWLGSITPDNAKAGKEMAQSLVDFAQQKDWEPPYRLLSISGDNKTPASLYRNSGLDVTIKQSGQLKEVARKHALWSEEIATHITTDTLTDTPQAPQLIWAANDNIAMGAMTAMQTAGLQAGKDYAIAGLNWSEQGLKAVQNGQMTLTHGGHFFAGAWALIVLNDLHNGHPITADQSHIRFPMTAITKQNVDEYLAKFASQDWGKINFLKFSKAHNKTLKAYDFSLPRILEAVEK